MSASSTRSPPGPWPGWPPWCRGCWPGPSRWRFVDIDDTIREVHGYHKQGVAYGYSGVKGLNAQIAALSSPTCAPVIAAPGCARATPSPGTAPTG